MNEVKLQEGHPVDENLRPIKVGGKSTALETAQHGNGARVNGDLEVTGDIKGNVKDVELDLTTIVSTDLTIDDSGDITLDAAGGDVNILQADLTIPVDKKVIFGNTGEYIVGDDSDLDIVSSGRANITATTAGKIDAGTTFLVDAGTSITLDSGNGRFLAKNAGTDFSVANSSFAGMILGYTTVGIDATSDSYTLTATMTAIDDAMKVKFVAPPSGVVEIFASLYWDTSRRLPVLGLSDASATTGYSAIDFPNANDVTNEHVVAMPPISLADTMLNKYWVVTGLTAGTAYEWWFSAKTSASTGGVLRWGGTATNQYPPFIMKATALPTAVADYAVYG